MTNESSGGRHIDRDREVMDSKVAKNLKHSFHRNMFREILVFNFYPSSIIERMIMRFNIHLFSHIR